MGIEQLSKDQIFNVAAELHDPVARASYLDHACAEKPELRVEIEDLLARDSAQDSFLNSPISNYDVTIDRPIAEGPGTVIGPYKLLQQIGEGGMGVVFMAEQTEPIQRTVALKIIKPGMDTRQVIARFEAERQAVAMMDHPNIAKVLDAGTTDSGRPYFVMELVKGVPITKYCDEKHLPLRARLELFVQVCQAVQHAHQKGIIHRDLKPNNVLVAEYDNHAVPKVIDFGVAKATAQRLTERTMFTEFGQVLGTMEYMSPEQSKFNQLDIDTRSDIYSLGVLLYELLAGSTPFEGKRLHAAAFDEMLRIIREEEPQKPSTRLSSIDTLPSVAANRHTEPARLRKEVSGELDWIVMKALEKDRNRRYETASGFAADIERHLHDEPVEAGPPTYAYRLKKFARRNKVGVTAGSAIALALAVGFLLASIGFIQARQQANIARTQAARVIQVQQFLEEMLGSIDPNTEKGSAVTVQQVLDRAAAKVEKNFADQPEIRAVLHETIGRNYFGLRLFEPAVRHLQLAVDLRRRYLTEEPIELAGALYLLADSLTSDLSQREKALSHCRDAVAIYALRLPENDARLAEARSLEAMLSGQGATAGRINSDVFVATLLPITLTLTDDQLARSPAEWTRAVVEAKRLHGAGDIAGARAALKQGHIAAIARIRELCSTGQPDAARQYMRQTYTPFLETPSMRPLVPLGLIGVTHAMQSESEDPRVIEAVLREAVSAGHNVWGPEHPNIAWALSDLAKLLREQGKLSDAEPFAREAFAMRRKILGDEHPDTVESLKDLIDVLQQGGKSAEAKNLRREMAVPAAAASPPSTDPKPTAP
jgi:serine/threonine protein kinase